MVLNSHVGPKRIQGYKKLKFLINSAAFDPQPTNVQITLMSLSNATVSLTTLVK